MRFLFDTNICIYLINRSPAPLINRIQSLEPGEIGLPTIVIAELQYAAYNSQKIEQNLAALEKFLLPFEIVPFDMACTRAYGRLRADLRRSGQPVGSMDMLIAAQAIAHNLVLVTNNEQEFSRISALNFENWVH